MSVFGEFNLIVLLEHQEIVNSEVKYEKTCLNEHSLCVS